MNEETTKHYRPKLAFYHPNGKGTGCAVNMSLHPAHDNHDGCIMLSMANQLTVGDRRAPNPTFPRFGWDDKINVKLDFNDLCKILQVMRGECESVGDGKGIYHRSVKYTTRIVFRHMLEPIQGYSLEVYRVPLQGEAETHSRIIFSTSEALGLEESIAGSMAVIAFGIPVVLPHDTSAYEAEVAEARNVPEA